jgi:hypothetical protein
MISEKNFAGNSEYIFSLALTDGLPTLNVNNTKKGFLKAIV